MKNAYEILNINKNDDIEIITKAYNKILKNINPKDKATLKTIEFVYLLLADTNRRKLYDAFSEPVLKNYNMAINIMSSDVSKAIKYLEAVYDENNPNILINSLLADLYAQIKNFNKAIQLLKKIEDNDFTNHTLFQMLFYYLNNKDIENANIISQRILTKEPNNLDLEFKVINSYFITKNLELGLLKMKPLLEKAKKINNNNLVLRIYDLLINILIFSNNFEEANKLLNSLMIANSNLNSDDLTLLLTMLYKTVNSCNIHYEKSKKDTTKTILINVYNILKQIEKIIENNKNNDLYDKFIKCKVEYYSVILKQDSRIKDFFVIFTLSYFDNVYLPVRSKEELDKFISICKEKIIDDFDNSINTILILKEEYPDAYSYNQTFYELLLKAYEKNDKIILNNISKK